MHFQVLVAAITIVHQSILPNRSIQRLVFGDLDVKNGKIGHWVCVGMLTIKQLWVGRPQMSNLQLKLLFLFFLPFLSYFLFSTLLFKFRFLCEHLNSSIINCIVKMQTLN